ncbi:MAG: hypothetical protein A3K77_07590 [Euryarchaeota archaeon RBG_13_31_8]|nr:MAG: hypothetical protein A3K77_07590 [Euryarchaeota archaeon RBG_13_31_8]
MSKEIGIKAEHFFADLLNKAKLNFEYTDDWYDFLVENKHKVEVKSCMISTSNGNNKKEKKNKRIGRFYFTSNENSERQYKENIWICLVVRNIQQYMIIGFLRAEQINKKRYLSIHQANNLKLISFEQWLSEVAK